MIEEKNTEHKRLKYIPLPFNEERAANVSKVGTSSAGNLGIRLPYHESYRMHARIEKLAKEAGVSKNRFMVDQINAMLDVLDPQG